MSEPTQVKLYVVRGDGAAVWVPDHGDGQDVCRERRWTWLGESARTIWHEAGRVSVNVWEVSGELPEGWREVPRHRWVRAENRWALEMEAALRWWSREAAMQSYARWHRQAAELLREVAPERADLWGVAPSVLEDGRF